MAKEKVKKPTLTKEDWEEIYYAVDTKLNHSAVTKGSDSKSVKWRAHLRRIMKTIGPDGRNMYA